MLSSVLGNCRSVPLPFLFVPQNRLQAIFHSEKIKGDGCSMEASNSFSTFEQQLMIRGKSVHDQNCVKYKVKNNQDIKVDTNLRH